MINYNTLLLDTNTVLYLIKGDENVLQLLNQKPVAINFITEIELLGWKNMTSELEKTIIELINEVRYFDYSYLIKQRTIALRRKYNLKLGDAFIASTAIEHNLTLVSADQQFSKLEEISLINFSPSV